MYETYDNKVDVLARPFRQMGARVRFGELHPDRRGVELDVRTDKDGEYFLVSKSVGAKIEVLNVQADERHLLLLSRTGEGKGQIKARFLLGMSATGLSPPSLRALRSPP